MTCSQLSGVRSFQAARSPVMATSRGSAVATAGCPPPAMRTLRQRTKARSAGAPRPGDEPHPARRPAPGSAPPRPGSPARHDDPHAGQVARPGRRRRGRAGHGDGQRRRRRPAAPHQPVARAGRPAAVSSQCAAARPRRAARPVARDVVRRAARSSATEQPAVDELRGATRAAGSSGPGAGTARARPETVVRRGVPCSRGPGSARLHGWRTGRDEGGGPRHRRCGAGRARPAVAGARGGRRRAGAGLAGRRGRSPPTTTSTRATRKKVDAVVSTADPDVYAALVLPGGVINGDFVRADADAVAFVTSFFDAGKPVAAICHAPWVLDRGRRGEGPADDVVAVAADRPAQRGRRLGGRGGRRRRQPDRPAATPTTWTRSARRSSSSSPREEDAERGRGRRLSRRTARQEPRRAAPRRARW